MATIQEFRSSFVGDLAKPSRFDVVIGHLPDAIATQSGIDTKTLSLRCEAAELPGRSFAVVENKIYGTSDKYVYQTSFNDSSMTFIVSDTMQERYVFDCWMKIMQPSNTWNFEYKKTYSTDITISQYDNANRKIYDVVLREAFPVMVNQMDLDWSNADTHHKLNVTFSYDYWESNIYVQSTPGSGPLKANMFNIGQILAGYGAAQTVGRALSSKNPYDILGAIGQLGSMAPTFGNKQTASNFLNTQGSAAYDAINDSIASAVNKFSKNNVIDPK